MVTCMQRELQHRGEGEGIFLCAHDMTLGTTSPHTKFDGHWRRGIELTEIKEKHSNMHTQPTIFFI